MGVWTPGPGPTSGNDTFIGDSTSENASGGDGNDTLDGGAGADTLIGGLGDDTYVVDNVGDVVTELSEEGTDEIRTTLASYSLGSNVENLVFTGTIAFAGTGNDEANVITSGTGNDTLDGGAGADTLIGGVGDDTFVVDNADDLVTELNSEGTDTVQSSITYTLGSNLENLTLTGSSAINATGNSLNNILTGNSSANTLDGGAGADTLIGGLGDDSYVVDDAGDVVTELNGEGTDSVQSSITYTLGSNLENLILTGSSAINGTGNALNNVLTGNSGNNILSGKGGNDTLEGAAGADIFVIAKDAGITTVADFTPGVDRIDLFDVGIRSFAEVESKLYQVGSDVEIRVSSTTTVLLQNVQKSSLTASDIIGFQPSASIRSFDFSVLIDPTDEIPDITVRVQLEEGATSARVLYRPENGQEQWLTLTFNSNTGLFEYNGHLSKYAVSGVYELITFTFEDSQGVNVTVNATELSARGFDIRETLSNPNSDQVAPTLTSFIFDAPFINGVGDYVLPFRLSAADIGPSGLDGIWGVTAYVTTPNTVIGTSLYLDDTGAGSGAFLLGPNTPSGNYSLHSVLTRDLAGNLNDNTAFAEQQPRSVAISNPNADTTSPSLTAFTLRAVFDPVTDRPKIIIEGRTTDGQSGIGTAFVQLVGPSYVNSLYNLYLYGPTPDSVPFADRPKTVDFNSFIALVTDFFPGAYSVNFLSVWDSAHNGAFFSNSDSLRALGFDPVVHVYFPTSSEQTVVTGSENDDFIFGTNAGSESLQGGLGNDYLFGGDGDDTVDGGQGDDEIIGGSGAGDDVYFGGDGIDTVRYASAQAGIEVNLQAGIARSRPGQLDAGIGTDTLSGIENVSAGAFDDLLIGDGFDNLLLGLGGRDFLDGGSGADTLDGGSGADTLVGGLGDDSYVVDTQADLIFENAGEGRDSVTASVGFYLYAHVEDLTLASGAGDIFGVGNELNNVLTGNEASNLLLGGSGNDTLSGGAGVDALFGEDGDDLLLGEAGIDYLVGGAGADTLNGGADADALYGEDGNDLLIGGAGFVTDILVGGAGADTLDGASGLNDYDLMDGGPGDDVYFVDTGDDLTFEAVGGGTDTVFADIALPNAGVYLYANVENLVLLGTTAFGVGNELNNVLTGSSSGNWLLGGAGNDTLNGKAGNDVLFGEAGADVFIFERGSGADVIGDFVVGVDRIDLSDFSIASFSALQTRFVQVGSDGAIRLDTGELIVLIGVTMSSLTAADFILSQGQLAAPASRQAPDVVSFEITGWTGDRGGAVQRDDDGHSSARHEAWARSVAAEDAAPSPLASGLREISLQNQDLLAGYELTDGIVWLPGHLGGEYTAIQTEGVVRAAASTDMGRTARTEDTAPLAPHAADFFPPASDRLPYPFPNDPFADQPENWNPQLDHGNTWLV